MSCYYGLDLIMVVCNVPSPHARQNRSCTELLQPQDPTETSVGENINANAHGNSEIGSNLSQNISDEAGLQRGQDRLKGGVKVGQGGTIRQACNRHVSAALGIAEGEFGRTKPARFRLERLR